MREAHWTLGVLIGIPALALLVIVCLVVAVIAIVRIGRGEDDGTWGFLISSFLVMLMIVGLALAPVVGFYPYKAEYHQWRPVSGVVSEVGKRLVAQDKSMAERYVLVIGGQPYGVDDTRASLVKVGDTVSLSCKRDWQYASVPGDVCRWNS